MTDTPHTLVADLSELLDAERAALLEGNLDQVTSLLNTKENLFDQISSNTLNEAPELQALDRKIKHNQSLLDGALEGIRTVAERMSALQRVQTSLETYGADGMKKQVQLKRVSTVERRA